MAGAAAGALRALRVRTGAAAAGAGAGARAWVAGGGPGALAAAWGPGVAVHAEAGPAGAGPAARAEFAGGRAKEVGLGGLDAAGVARAVARLAAEAGRRPPRARPGVRTRWPSVQAPP